jgi:DNA repair exonuclease SbcCD ATPase subunit
LTLENKLKLTELLQEKLYLTEQSTPLSEYSDSQMWSIAYQNIQNRVREEENKLHLLERELNDCKVKQIHLEGHKYDPDCEFCVDNQFVKDAQQAIEKIPELEQTRISLLGWLDIYKNSLETSKQSFESAQEYQSILKQLSVIDSKVQLLNEQVKTLKLKSESLEVDRNNIQVKKSEYESNVLLITKNNDILNSIVEVEKEIKQLNLQYDLVQKNHRSVELEISKLKTEYSDINLKLDKYLDYLKKYRVYELYSQTVSRDGVPYKIVELVLPVLENEVNLILNSIANFTVKLEATDEKYIHAFINYGPNQIWPVELSSGMERFILSLAFRVALTEITSLPKSCFLAIDEGFGVLDAENILQIGKLFEYLKTQYEFLICISHIDTMRDLVDKQIKINRVDGYSKVEYLNVA